MIDVKKVIGGAACGDCMESACGTACGVYTVYRQ